MLVLGIVFGLPPCFGAVFAWQQPSSSIAQWVQQLGDEDYEVRQLARQRLLVAGPNALVALQKAERASDLEIRLSARTIRLTIENRLVDQQVAAFTSPKATATDSLPGWQRFEKRVGDSQQSRRLYADMYQRFPTVFRSLNSTRPVLEVEYQAAIKEFLRKRYYSPRMGEQMAIAVFVGLELIDREQKGEPSFERRNLKSQLLLINKSILDPKTVSLVSKNKHFALIQRLLDHWCQQLLGQNRAFVDQVVQVASRYRLTSQSDRLLALARDEQIDIRDRAAAVRAIGELADQEILPLLQPLIESRQAVRKVVSPHGTHPDFTVELGDIALASSIILSGLKIVDFRFSARNSSLANSSLTLSGFSSEQNRLEAKKKWQKYYQESFNSRE